MSGRLAMTAVAGAVAASVAASAALGAGQAVVATDQNTWTPTSVTVAPGESVAFRNPTGAGFHDLQFEGESSPFVQPGQEWATARSFTTSTRFRCTLHSNGYGDGMSGSVIVQPATATATATATAAPGATATPTATPFGYPIAGARPRLVVRRAARSFRRGRVKLRVTLAGTARTLVVRGTLQRAGSVRRIRVSFTARPGTRRTVRLRVRLRPGRYVLRLRRPAGVDLDGSRITFRAR